MTQKMTVAKIFYRRNFSSFVLRNIYTDLLSGRIDIGRGEKESGMKTSSYSFYECAKSFDLDVLHFVSYYKYQNLKILIFVRLKSAKKYIKK